MPTFTYFNPQQNQTAVLNSFPSPVNGVTTLQPGIYTLPFGTYSFSSNVLIPSSTQIIGTSPLDTVIQFTGANGFITLGVDLYTTGTITAILGVNVTGSGTAWLANVQAGQSIFIGTQWYPIAAVTSDTTLILGQAYGDDVSLPATYRTASVTNSVIFQNLTIQGSVGTGMAFSDTTQVIIENVQSLENNAGVSFLNCSDVQLDAVTTAASISDGIQGTNMGLCDWNSVNSEGNGGNGITLSNVKKFYLSPGDFEGNTGDGLNVTRGIELNILSAFEGNGGNGISFVSGCENCSVFNSGFQGNGGYGIDIEDSSSANNILLGNIFQGNTSGAVNDSGTTDLIRSNIGVADN